MIDYFYFHFKFNDFYFYFYLFIYFILFYFIFLLFYFAWDFDSCAYGRWAATYRKDHGWDFLVERYGSLETKVEQTKLTKNKIRRLLGRIMVLESKTPQRSREDFYTLKVENFRKIWITYGNQGQGGFSTTSGILVDYHFSKIIACTNSQHITHIIDSLMERPQILFKVGCHFHHAGSTQPYSSPSRGPARITDSFQDTH